MSKRFTETELWEEDWFIELPRDYQLFWIFLKDSCDHAGFWKPNFSKFNMLYKCQIEAAQALEYFNKGREKGEERVLLLPSGKWFLPAFIPFQYGKSLNENNRVHKSIIKILTANEVNLTSIRPQVEPYYIIGAKDKDKDKDKDKIQPLSATPTPKPPSNPTKTPVRELMSFFYAEYERTFGDKYVASFAKDGAIFKDLLVTVDKDRLIGLVRSFFSSQDDFILKAGYTVGVFKSQINKLKSPSKDGIPDEWRTKK